MFSRIVMEEYLYHMVVLVFYGNSCRKQTTHWKSNTQHVWSKSMMFSGHLWAVDTNMNYDIWTMEYELMRSDMIWSNMMEYEIFELRTSMNYGVLIPMVMNSTRWTPTGLRCDRWPKQERSNRWALLHHGHWMGSFCRMSSSPKKRGCHQDVRSMSFALFFPRLRSLVLILFLLGGGVL